LERGKKYYSCKIKIKDKTPRHAQKGKGNTAPSGKKKKGKKGELALFLVEKTSPYGLDAVSPKNGEGLPKTVGEGGSGRPFSKKKKKRGLLVRSRPLRRGKYHD